MIKISWAYFFLLYLLGALIFLFSLWLKSHFKEGNKKHRLPHNTLQVCEYCQTVYTKPQETKLSRCPVCHSITR